MKYALALAVILALVTGPFWYPHREIYLRAATVNACFNEAYNDPQKFAAILISTYAPGVFCK